MNDRQRAYITKAAHENMACKCGNRTWTVKLTQLTGFRECDMLCLNCGEKKLYELSQSEIDEVSRLGETGSRIGK